MGKVDPNSVEDGYYTGVGKKGENTNIGVLVVNGEEHMGLEFEFGDPAMASNKRRGQTRPVTTHRGKQPTANTLEQKVDDLAQKLELLTDMMLKKEGYVEKASADANDRKKYLLKHAPWRDEQLKRDEADLADAFAQPEDEPLFAEEEVDEYSKLQPPAEAFPDDFWRNI